MNQVVENPVKNHHQFSVRKYKIFVVLVTILITSYLTANIMAVKLISVFGITLFDAGTITFPISYLIGDIITEVYGFKNARRVISLTFFCNIFLVLATTIGIFLPSPDFTVEISNAYATVFTVVPRILVASLIAFFAGEMTNAWFMDRIKRWTDGKHLWLRTIGSSAVGYLVDTVLFVLIAFTAPAKDLFTLIIAQYFMKLGLEAICATPIAYVAIRWINKEDAVE